MKVKEARTISEWIVFVLVLRGSIALMIDTYNFVHFIFREFGVRQ
jgi:hypothetical protein